MRITEENSTCKAQAHESGLSVFMTVRFYSADCLIPMTERDVLSVAGVLLVGPVSGHALVKVGAQSLSCPVLPGGSSQTVVTANRVA